MQAFACVGAVVLAASDLFDVPEVIAAVTHPVDDSLGPRCCLMAAPRSPSQVGGPEESPRPGDAAASP